MATIKTIQRKKGTAYQIGYTLHGIRLLSGTTNLMIECGKAGYDWEEITMQAAKERELRESLGLIFDTSKLKKESKDKEDEE